MELKTYVTIDYKEIDQIIEGFYGIEEISSSMELLNDSSIAYDDIGIGYYSEYNEQDIETALESEDLNLAYGLAYSLLYELAYFDLIPKGNYLIDVMW